MNRVDLEIKRIENEYWYYTQVGGYRNMSIEVPNRYKDEIKEILKDKGYKVQDSKYIEYVVQNISRLIIDIR